MSYSTQSPRIGNGQGKRPDVYQIVTDKVIALLERGAVPWSKPWRGGIQMMPKNAISKKEYRGVNVFLLGMTAEIEGYDSAYWLSYKQAETLGGHVKNGEKSTLIVFWKMFEKRLKAGETPSKTPEMIPFLRYYRVFNVNQCENLDWSKIPSDAQGETLIDDLDFTPIEVCENTVKNWIKRPDIEHKGGRACYAPFSDVVTMPEREKFRSESDYYSTLFHELTHSTGHKSRLNRHQDDSAWSINQNDYSKEELIAEMGAAFLCGVCGIETETIENSAAYIQGWLKQLKNDRKLVVTAAAAAQKSSDMIRGIRFDN